jgi:hypothetical protein
MRGELRFRENGRARESEDREGRAQLHVFDPQWGGTSLGRDGAPSGGAASAGAAPTTTGPARSGAAPPEPGKAGES